MSSNYTRCNICNGTVEAAFTAKVLRAYEASFLQCRKCHAVQADNPTWLAEAYSDALVSGDTGILRRNHLLSHMCAGLFWNLHGPGGKYVDVAGGYGVFTRMMRDFGFNYFWNDPYAQNLFSRGFEALLDDGPYDALTAFEALEHMTNPYEFLAEHAARTGARTLVVSTETFEGPRAPPLDWWYYGFNSGQHITFFTPTSLQLLAERLGMRLYSRGSFHVFTSERLNPMVFAAVSRPRLAPLLSVIPRLRQKSRIMSDHLAIADL